MINLDQWNIINNNPDAWQLRDEQLYVDIAEGNMWGYGGEPKENLFLLPVDKSSYHAQVNVELTSKRTFEQAGIGVFWDKDNYIKISKEMFNGELSLVFASEKGGNPSIVCLVPYSGHKVSLKLDVKDNAVTAYYRKDSSSEWNVVGSTTRHEGQEQGIILYTFSGNKAQPNRAVFSGFVYQ
ncbi:hypothetical protein JCM19233_271 [Vibrio astriarenae]|nr:hypothetical protein JCM19233_271 [Vibrio sp. C7]